MARQVLSQHIKAELAVIEEKKQEREEHNPNGRIIASKKSLKFYLTAKYLQRDILCSNRFLKCQVSIKKLIHYLVNNIAQAYNQDRLKFWAENNR